jgi:hypothetical protein
LIESLQTSELPTPLPFEVHLYYEFDEAERGREYAVRLVLMPHTPGRQWRSDPVTVVSHTMRHRIVIQGISVPAFGRFYVRAEVRPADDVAAQWETSSFGWPLEVSQVTGDVPSPSSV